ncbi:MAG: MoxR family ATPase [Bdellovibrionota bacterium]
MSIDVAALTEQVRQKSKFVDDLTNEVSLVVVGQRMMIDRILMALLCDGHILLEGLPGLAKTLTIKTVADAISSGFQRIQFTPDLLPADLIGTVIYNQRTGEFTPKLGPIHSNIVLADEINRAPAKVQSALLEAMAEKQVTIADQTYHLKDPFIVLATQNPIEQEGTYPLPEAQMDRFMFKVKVSYPTLAEEKAILNRMTSFQTPKAKKVIPSETLLEARELVSKIYMDEKIKDYILSIVFASRFPEKYGLSDLKSMIQVGASPRATIFLAKAARASAFLSHRGFVTPEDIKTIAFDILRHRIMVTYEAEADQLTSDAVIKRILDKIEVP